MKKPPIERLTIELNELTESVNIADEIARKYTENSDITEITFFESCKIELNNIMVELSSYYARFRAANDYYDQYRKQVKAERLEYLLDEVGMNTTKAKELVYSEEVYKEFLKEFNMVKRIYFMVSRKYSLYEATMQNIKQTIANLKREQQYENELKVFSEKLDSFEKVINKAKKLFNIK